MPGQRVNVLLVGEGLRTATTLHKHLERHACDLRMARSYREAAALLRNGKYDLVLSEFLLSDGTAFRLVPLLRGTDTTMFFSNAVEDGYWWLNAIRKGQERLDEPGMRPGEFKRLLEEILSDKLLGPRNQGIKEEEISKLFVEGSGHHWPAL